MAVLRVRVTSLLTDRIVTDEIAELLMSLAALFDRHDTLADHVAHCFDARDGSETEVQAQIVVGVVARLAEHDLRLLPTGCLDPHDRAERRAIRLRAFELHAD